MWVLNKCIKPAHIIRILLPLYVWCSDEDFEYLPPHAQPISSASDDDIPEIAP